MADLSQPNNPFSPGGDDHLSRLLLIQNDEPMWKSLVRNIKETFNPPKLPPLELTSKPVAVKDIWGLYGNPEEIVHDVVPAFQICLVLLVILALSTKPVQNARQADGGDHHAGRCTQPAAVKVPMHGGGGGGGDRSPLPASKGASCLSRCCASLCLPRL